MGLLVHAAYPSRLSKLAAMVARRALRGTDPLGYVKPLEPERCPLCGRVLEPGASVDEHHLVPKSKGGKVKSLIHRICHRKIHEKLGSDTNYHDAASLS